MGVGYGASVTTCEIILSMLCGFACSDAHYTRETMPKFI